MKLKGQKLQGPAIEVIVLPRQCGNLVFKAQAVIEDKEFDSLCPRPIPPKKLMPGGVTQINVEDPEYKKSITEFAIRRTHWMILKSLQATTDLEWETVKMDDPSTWSNFAQEFLESGLTAIEVNRIIDVVMTVNGLNEKKIDEATKAFLAGPAVMPNIL